MKRAQISLENAFPRNKMCLVLEGFGVDGRSNRKIKTGYRRDENSIEHAGQRRGRERTKTSPLLEGYTYHKIPIVPQHMKKKYFQIPIEMRILIMTTPKDDWSIDVDR